MGGCPAPPHPMPLSPIKTTESIEIMQMKIPAGALRGAGLGGAFGPAQGSGGGEGGGFQHGRRGVAGGQQHLADGAGSLVDAVGAAMIRSGADAGAERQRAVGLADDVGERDLFRRPAEQVTALPPA